jgi:hypothetical protein
VAVPPVLVRPSKEVACAPSPVGMKNPASAPWSLRVSWSILFSDKIMKTKVQNFRQTLRQIFRPRVRRHDAMLVFNMWSFNFSDGWSRIFAKEQYGRFSV